MPLLGLKQRIQVAPKTDQRVAQEEQRLRWFRLRGLCSQWGHEADTVPFLPIFEVLWGSLSIVVIAAQQPTLQLFLAGCPWTMPPCISWQYLATLEDSDADQALSRFFMCKQERESLRGINKYTEQQHILTKDGTPGKQLQLLQSVGWTACEVLTLSIAGKCLQQQYADPCDMVIWTLASLPGRAALAPDSACSPYPNCRSH